MKRKLRILKCKQTKEEFIFSSKRKALKLKNELPLRDEYWKMEFVIEEKEEDDETIPF